MNFLRFNCLIIYIYNTSLHYKKMYSSHTVLEKYKLIETMNRLSVRPNSGPSSSSNYNSNYSSSSSNYNSNYSNSGIPTCARALNK